MGSDPPAVPEAWRLRITWRQRSRNYLEYLADDEDDEQRAIVSNTFAPCAHVCRKRVWPKAGCSLNQTENPSDEETLPLLDRERYEQLIAATSIRRGHASW